MRLSIKLKDTKLVNLLFEGLFLSLNKWLNLFAHYFLSVCELQLVSHLLKLTKVMINRGDDFSHLLYLFFRYATKVVSSWSAVSLLYF